MTLAPAYPRNGVGFQTGGKYETYALRWWRCNGACILVGYGSCAWGGTVTYEQALAYNKAIEDALREYKNGIGAIKQLKLKFAADVEHIGTTTKQDVREVE